MTAATKEKEREKNGGDNSLKELQECAEKGEGRVDLEVYKEGGLNFGWLKPGKESAKATTTTTTTAKRR